MGAAASAGLAVATQTTSIETLAAALRDLPAADRAKLATAVGSVGRAEGASRSEDKPKENSKEMSFHVKVISATSGESIGEWKLAAENVKDVEDKILSEADNAVVRVKLVHDEKILEGSKSLAEFPAEESGLMLGCIKQDTISAISESLGILDACFGMLDKRSLCEIRAYAKPPQPVMVTMCAVMVLMEMTPTWAHAKTMLGDGNGFVQRVRMFDKDNIAQASLRKLEKFRQQPDFKPAIVANASPVCGVLCQWVLMMQVYADPTLHERNHVCSVLDSLRDIAEKLGPKQAAGGDLGNTTWKLNRKNAPSLTIEEFKTSQDYLVLQELVAIQEELPFVATDSISDGTAKAKLERWTTLTEKLAQMLFEQGPELHFPLQLVFSAREMSSMAGGVVVHRACAERFLKDIDCYITKIGSKVGAWLALESDLASFLAELAELLSEYVRIWKVFGDLCTKCADA